MVATKMAPDRVAAVNLGKQMVARDLFHHVVNAHDFEVRVDLAKLSLSQPIIRSKILPLSERTFLWTRIGLLLFLSLQ